jgi:hypothetical protein
VTRTLAAWLLALLTAAFAIAGLVLGGGTLGGTYGADRSIWPGDLFQLMSLLATAVVGLTIALRRPGNPIGWIFSAYGLTTAIYLAAGGYAIHVAIAPGSLPAGEWAAWIRNWVDRSASAFVLLAFLLFPTGRLASPRWRLALAVPPLTALGFAARAFTPGPMDFLGVPNPAGLEWVPQSVAVGWTGGIPASVGTFVALAELRIRFRAAVGTEREQIKWLTIPVVALVVAIAATVAAIAGLAMGVLTDDASVTGGAAISAFYSLAFFLLPICMGIAVMRYRLYDIDVLINRALVYGATTAGIAVAFFVGIILLQALLRPITGGSEIAVALSTLASVALFQPLRRRLQDAVDRRFYRSRYDSARTLDAFSVRLRDQVALDAVRADLIDAAGATVQPAHASLWLRDAR